MLTDRKSLAGIAVLFASLYSTLDHRIRDGALLRTLGAKRKLIRMSQLIEFSILGLISGLLAMVICETISYFLYNFVLKMDYDPKWILWAIVPASSAFFIGFTGFWAVRKVVRKSPVQVLREL